MRTSLTTAVAAVCAVAALTGCSSQSSRSAASSAATLGGSASVGSTTEPSAPATTSCAPAASGAAGKSSAPGSSTTGTSSSGGAATAGTSAASSSGAAGKSSSSASGGSSPSGGTSGTGTTGGGAVDASVSSTPPGNKASVAAAPAAGSTTTNPSGSPTRVYLIDNSGKTLVNASLIPSYLDSSGVLAPPVGTAGWYAERGWVQPGRAGTSVLVGHVTYAGVPDTFYNLIHATVGNKVIVRYSSGDQVVFRVTASRGEAKSAVPKDRSIWDPTSSPSLRLITCDPATPMRAGHFSGNWVVWAVPA